MKVRPNTDASAAHDALNVAWADLRQHKDSPAYRAVTDWLNAVAARVQTEMTDASLEDIGDLQQRFKQVVALRDALEAPSDRAGAGFIV